jgi:tellurite resistance protein TerC
MNKTEVLYLVFGAVLVAALVFDLGFFSKKNIKITLKAALLQTLFWVILSFAFCGFILVQNKSGAGHADAVSYITAYLLEWSLSVDNIFVFIIFRCKGKKLRAGITDRYPDGDLFPDHIYCRRQ